MLLDLLSESLLALPELLNRFIGFSLVILLFSFLPNSVHLFLYLGLLLLKLGDILLPRLLQILNARQSLLIRHQWFDSYKFPELQILNVVLGVLVDVELVQILQEDIL